MPPKRANLPNRPAAKSRKNENIRYRCSPHLLPPIMKRIVGNDNQKRYVGEIGFGSFLSMADFEMNKSLTVWLVGKFNCDTEALEFEGGISIPVRPLVKSVLGIPSGPIQVVEGLDVEDSLYARYTYNNCIGANAKKVAEDMHNITEKEPFCIAFMMAMLGFYLAPSTSLAVGRAFLGAVKQVDKLKEMDWCNFVATYLFKGIKKFKESKKSNTCITGCVHLLSVIFIDFVKHAAFEVPVGFPRLGFVTRKHIKWVVSHPFTSLMIREMMHVTPDAPKRMNCGLTSPMENAGDPSTKKARVDQPSSGQAKRDRVVALDMSFLNCTLCCGPCKPPVFQCNGRHLACGRCLAELPGEQCKMCEHGSGFSPCPIMDDMVKLAMVECSHDGCKSSVPYHELNDHENSCPHAPCYCTESDCDFVGPPPALLDHLSVLHSVPVHKVHYGEVHRLRMSETRCLLHGVGDGSVFLLAVSLLGAATVVSVVCVRAGVALLPRYAIKLWANGPPPPNSAAGSILLDIKAVTSSARLGEVVVEELPSFLMVPPAYLVVSGASKDVTLDIRIDKM